MNQEDLDKFFKMSKLIPREIHFEKILKMIDEINSINVDGEDVYEKEWIKTSLRKDIPVADDLAKNFGKKENGFFVLPEVIKNG